MKFGPKNIGPKVSPVTKIQGRNYKKSPGSHYGTREQWYNKRQLVLRRDNYTCNRCSKQYKPPLHGNLHVDHIIPLSKGGSNSTYNLQTLCQNCHKAKHPHMK